MNKTITTILSMLLIAPGCGLEFAWGDPCETDAQGEHTNPSWNGLSDAQKAECDLCGNVECNGTETGGDGGDDLSLTCDGTPQIDGDSVMCFNGPIPDGDAGLYWRGVDPDECHFLSGPIPCGLSYSTPVQDATHECWLCEVQTYGEVVDQPTHAGSGWEICQRPNPTATENHNYPAIYNDWGEDAASISIWNWLEQQSCYDPQEITDHICDMVLVDPRKPTYDNYGLLVDGDWTCRCDANDDADCQPGTVCEGGYYFEGLHPTPTYCVWPEEENGGPEIYGLDDWAGGVIVDGHDITVTPAFIMAAGFGRAGLWNDSQSWDLEGDTATIRRCEADSLCAHLGLEAGDTINGLGIDLVETLPTGEPVQLWVEHGEDLDLWSLTVTAS